MNRPNIINLLDDSVQKNHLRLSLMRHEAMHIIEYVRSLEKFAETYRKLQEVSKPKLT